MPLIHKFLPLMCSNIIMIPYTVITSYYLRDTYFRKKAILPSVLNGKSITETLRCPDSYN